MENMETGSFLKVAKKRDRSENWLSEDKHLLKELVRERVSVIENKNTDTNTNAIKKKAWADLLYSFNCMCKGSKRTLSQLKSQWGIIKMHQKRLKSAERKQIIATGGGPPSPPQQDPEQGPEKLFNFKTLKKALTKNLIINDTEEQKIQEPFPMKICLPKKRPANFEKEDFLMLSQDFAQSQPWDDDATQYDGCNIMIRGDDTMHTERTEDENYNACKKYDSTQIKYYEEKACQTANAYIQNSTTQTPNDDVDNKYLRDANDSFGMFVARELSIVPQIKRRQIMYEIIKLFEHRCA